MTATKESLISDKLHELACCRTGSERHINGHLVKRCVDGFCVDGAYGLSFDSAVRRIMPTVNDPIPFVRDQFGNQDV